MKIPSPYRRGQRRVWLIAALAVGGAVPTAASAAVLNWQSKAVSDPTKQSSTSNAVVDAAGNLTAIWLQNDGTSDRVAVANRPVSTKKWPAQSPTRYISVAGQSAIGLVSSVNGKGDAIAVWRVGNTVKETHRVGLGGAWSTPFDLRTTGQQVGHLAVALNDKGDTQVAWTEGTSVWTTNRSGIGSFVIPAKLTTGTTSRIDTVLAAVDPAGAGHVAWDQMQTGSNGTHMGVYLAKRPAGTANWMRSAQTDDTVDNTLSSLSVKANGSAFIGMTRDSGANAVAVVTPYTTTNVSVIAGTAKSFGGGDATSNPIVSANSKGDAVVGFSTTADQTNFDIALASYTKTGNTWSAPINVASGSTQRGLSVALAYSGVAVATWDENPSGPFRVRATTRTATTKVWGAPATLNDSADAIGLSERAGYFVGTWLSAGPSKVVNVGLLDTVAPKVVRRFSLNVPVKTPVTLRSSATDLMSPIVSYGWTFWDGKPPATGATVTHTFDKLGPVKLTLKATDAAGNIGRLEVVVNVVNYAAVTGYPIVGTSMACKTNLSGASFKWRRGTTIIGTGQRHTVGSGDFGKTLSCIAKTSKVTVTSAGRSVPRQCRVPSVGGKLSAVAQLAIKNAGCRVRVTLVAAGPLRVGKAIATLPAAGKLVNNGTTITLKVGK